MFFYCRICFDLIYFLYYFGWEFFSSLISGRRRCWVAFVVVWPDVGYVKCRMAGRPIHAWIQYFDINTLEELLWRPYFGFGRVQFRLKANNKFVAFLVVVDAPSTLSASAATGIRSVQKTSGVKPGKGGTTVRAGMSTKERRTRTTLREVGRKREVHDSCSRPLNEYWKKTTLTKREVNLHHAKVVTAVLSKTCMVVSKLILPSFRNRMYYPETYPNIAIVIGSL